MPKKVTASRGPSQQQVRRAAIAKAVVQQQSTPQIAAQLGISRQAVWMELQKPETKALIQSWMQPHHAAVKRMIPRALAAVNKGLKPSQEMRDRLAAVKTLGTVMEWSEGRTHGDADNKPTRWEGELTDLLVILSKVQTEP